MRCSLHERSPACGGGPYVGGLAGGASHKDPIYMYNVLKGLGRFLVSAPPN